MPNFQKVNTSKYGYNTLWAATLICCWFIGAFQVAHSQSNEPHITWQHTQETASWQVGYCADIQVENLGPASVQWQIEVPDELGNIVWLNEYYALGPAINSKGPYQFRGLNPLAVNDSVTFEYCVDNAPYPGDGTGGSVGDDDPCQQESDAEFCQRFNAECGTLVKIDNCGLERRVENCGECVGSESCGGGGEVNRCGHTDDTHPYITWQHTQETASWQVGYCADIQVENLGPASVQWQIEVPDELGNIVWLNEYYALGPAINSKGPYQFRGLNPLAVNDSVTFEYCVDNAPYPGDGTGGSVGDDDPCQQESDAEFCQRFNAECGTLVKIDNCGLERRVENCGECVGSESCGGGGEVNRCSSGSAQDLYDYHSVLEKSILFYEAQRSGKLPQNNRIMWRGDSALNDQGCHGAFAGIAAECDDLTGGWYEAGNNMKFNFPKASTVTFLTWGIIEFEESYLADEQMKSALEQIKWETDYMLKASIHVDNNFLWAQVGVPDIDFAWWGRPEDMTMPRDAFFIDADSPGSDLAGEYAAALASAAIMFARHEQNYPQYNGYAEQLLNRAIDSYAFAEKYRGLYHHADIPNAAEWYQSSSYYDELAWAAAWLYKATGNNEYLEDAHDFYDSASCPDLLEFSWDDKCPGVSILLSTLTDGSKQQKYMASSEKFLTYWLPPEPGDESGHIPYTKGGLAFYGPWGSLAYASNAAFAALLYREHLLSIAGHDNDPMLQKLLNFGMQQINYILGDMGHSFVVGFGIDPPQRPHHPASSCPTDEIPCMKYCENNSNCENAINPGLNPQELYGAVVGGPEDLNDTWIDDRMNYITNEVSVTYNASFQGAIAGIIKNKENLEN
jgi:endoglucanase